MTPRQLGQFGRELYGPEWQSSLARELEVNPRSVRRWASGEQAIDKRTSLAVFCLVAESRGLLKNAR